VGGGRELTPGEQALCARARDVAFVLYEGKRVAHRSCGIALAETFGLPSRPYQALRRGGITGEGECGAMKAGELVLGELLGDPDPAGMVTPALREAIVWYQGEIRRRLAAAGVLPAPDAPDIRCNTLTRRHDDFMGEPRKAMCTNIAAEVAAATAEAALRHGAKLRVIDVPETRDG
jgi:hypothetical protein